jgi:hypothetical protein
MSDIELVARFQPSGEHSWMAVPADSNLYDLFGLAAWHDPHSDEPGTTIGTITIEVRPAGWLAAWAEYERWWMSDE